MFFLRLQESVTSSRIWRERMSDRVDPITEEKESEVKAQDLQEDAAEKEETQEVLKTDALAEIPADEIPDEDFLAEPAEDEIVKEEELLKAEPEAETETETAAESPAEAVSGEAPEESATEEGSSGLTKKLAAFSNMSLRKKIAVGCGAAACVLAVVYIGIAQTYKTKFIEGTSIKEGTSINGIDAGKKTVSEVEDEIEKTVENYSLKLSFRDNRTETIDGDAFDYQYVSDGGVQRLLDEQNIYTWIGGALFGSEKSYTVDEDTQFNEQKLVEGLSNLPEMKSENQVARQTHIYFWTKPQNAIISFLKQRGMS